MGAQDGEEEKGGLGGRRGFCKSLQGKGSPQEGSGERG